MNARKPPSPSPVPPTDWSDAAQWYDQLVGQDGTEFHQQVILPGVTRLLALQPGQKALDIACGQGVLCRVLRERGVEVTGIDASAELIRAAHARSTDGATHYHVADARDLEFLPPDHFHAAACVLAIQNMHPLPPIFQSVARRLRAAGRFVIVMMHPCFRIARQTSWGWDEAAKVQYRRVDGYLLPSKTPIVTHPGKAPDVYTWTFHKPLEAYVKALRTAGMLVDALEEWPSHKTSDSGPRAPAENVARKQIPMFLALRAVKYAPPAAASAELTTTP
jgi:ubiquinone/menaquinone biosynthesis C-methylase UbiE